MKKDGPLDGRKITKRIKDRQMRQVTPKKIFFNEFSRFGTLFGPRLTIAALFCDLSSQNR